MKVLIGCETSGIVREAFSNQGHDAWSCDLLPSDVPTNKHIQDDVLNVMQDDFDMLIVAHPPCKRLCNSGVRWLKKPPNGKSLKQMWRELDDGATLFSKIWNVKHIPLIAIENPVMHKYAKERIENYVPFQQSIHPWEFAKSDNSPDNVKKRTCLWMKNLPNLKKTGKVDGLTARDECHRTPPSKDRWKIRSKFHVGIAEAMAKQWGSIDENFALNTALWNNL